jgi:Integrase core domain
LTAESNGFVERYNRTYSQECLQVLRPGTLSEACEVTATFERHSTFQRPNQALSCGNMPPRTAFPTLPQLPAVPYRVDPDAWLSSLEGLHLERKVDRTGCVKLDLKHYYVSSKLKDHRVTLQVDASERRLQVYREAHLLKSVPLKGLVGQSLSFERFVELMAQQARAQDRLRTAQERRRRTAESIPL